MEKIGWDRFCELSEVNERMLISDYRMLLSGEKNAIYKWQLCH